MRPIPFRSSPSYQVQGAFPLALEPTPLVNEIARAYGYQPLSSEKYLRCPAYYGHKPFDAAFFDEAYETISLGRSIPIPSLEPKVIGLDGISMFLAKLTLHLSFFELYLLSVSFPRDV